MAQVAASLRLVLFAMESAYSAAALRRLLRSSAVEVVALVVPPSAPAGFPPVRVGAHTNAAAADALAIPVIDHRDDATVNDRLSSLAPDLVVTVCYPRRIGAAIAAVPAVACLNLHPSLLPAYRGPDPLFWQLRAGQTRAGVTVHRTEPVLDAGAVLAARPVNLPCGWRREALDGRLGDAAAALLVEQLDGAPLRFLPQDESRATVQPMPSAADRVVPTCWPVRRAWNFLRGAAPAGMVFRITDGRETVAVKEAQEMIEETGSGLHLAAGGTVLARFADGSIRARAA